MTTLSHRHPDRHAPECLRIKNRKAGSTPLSLSGRGESCWRVKWEHVSAADMLQTGMPGGLSGETRVRVHVHVAVVPVIKSAGVC